MLRFLQHCLLSCPFAALGLVLGAAVAKEKTGSSVDQNKLRSGLEAAKQALPGKSSSRWLSTIQFRANNKSLSAERPSRRLLRP